MVVVVVVVVVDTPFVCAYCVCLSNFDFVIPNGNINE